MHVFQPGVLFEKYMDADLRQCENAYLYEQKETWNRIIVPKGRL